MKAVTANRLSDGAVVFLGAAGALVERFAEAQLFDGAEAEAALAALLEKKTAIVSAYVIDADRDGPIGRAAIRETIRKNGPTVRRDLGRQAEISR